MESVIEAVLVFPRAVASREAVEEDEENLDAPNIRDAKSKEVACDTEVGVTVERGG